MKQTFFAEAILSFCDALKAGAELQLKKILSGCFLCLSQFLFPPAQPVSFRHELNSSSIHVASEQPCSKKNDVFIIYN